MNPKNKLLMAQMKDTILDYFTNELELNSESLKQYETDALLPNSLPLEISKMREIEAIKLRDRIHEISRHISAIHRMMPIKETNERKTDSKQAKVNKGRAGTKG